MDNETTVPEQEQQTTQPQEGEQQGNWFDNLSSDLKSNPSIEKFKTGDDLAKSYLELQSQFGKDKVVIPQGDNPDEWSEVYSKLGVPESADGYKLPDVELPEGVSIDRRMFAEISKEAHLTPGQASKLFEKYAEYNKAVMERHNAEKEKQVGEMSKMLRGQWGNAYDSKIASGERLIETFARDQKHAAELKQEFGTSPSKIAFLADIADKFSENSIGDFKAQKFTMTPSEAKAKIDEIMANPSHAYHSDDPAVRGNAISYMESLYKMANGQR